MTHTATLFFPLPWKKHCVYSSDNTLRACRQCHAQREREREREKRSYERNIYSCVNLVHELHCLSREKRTVAESTVTIKLRYLFDQNIYQGTGYNTDMRHLKMGIRSEKCVVRRFHCCANVIECTYTNLDSIAYYTPKLYGIAYCP